MGRAYFLERHVNEKIKVGDKVRINDYSYITDFKDNTEVYGLHLNNPVATVTEVNVDTSVYTGTTKVVQQDVVMKIEGKKYRGLSRFLRKIRTPKEIIEDRLNKDHKLKSSLLQNSATVSEIDRVTDRIHLLEGLIVEIKNNEIR